MSVMWTTSLVLPMRATGKRGWSRKSITGSWRHHWICLDGGPCSETLRNASPSRRNTLPNLAPQMRVAFSRMASNTGLRSWGELEMTRSTPEVAVCCSRASARCSRASASSRVRSSSCFFNSTRELGPLLRRAVAFVLVERRPRACVRLFPPLLDKVTSSAQPLVAFRRRS